MQKLDTKPFGNSGCKIIIEDDLVTKISASEEYNQRLILQANKQSSYKGNFNTPKIQHIHTNEQGLVVVEMDRCGDPVATLEHHSVVLEQMLKWHVTQSIGWTDFRSQVMRKFFEVSKKIDDLDFCTKVIHKATYCNYILPVGYCHGDLTLSNILVDNGEFYLIDFLEDWIPSPAFDVCKIMQDCKFQWYTVDGEPFKQWHKSLGESVLVEYGSKFGMSHLEGIMLLTLFRVLPYCQGTKRGDFIKEAICREFL